MRRELIDAGRCPADGRAEAAALTRQLRAAVDSRDWPLVADLVETDWPKLLAIAVSALDEVLRALPAEVVAERLTIVAVRELRLNVHGDTRELDRLAMRAVPASNS